MTLAIKLMTAFTLVFIFISCKETGDKQTKKVVLNQNTIESSLSKSLQTKIISLINRQDSLANMNKIYSRHTSFWTHFYKKENLCYVAIVSNFGFYSSKTINGYLNYKDKVITFYGKETNCGNNLVRWDKLQSDKIKTLIDYDYADWKDKIPPKPPPPHEPYRREYIIVNQDSLKLIYEGY